MKANTTPSVFGAVSQNVEPTSGPSFRFSIRELGYFVTFLCVALALSVWAGPAMTFVLVHAAVLAIAIVVLGTRAYRSMLIGAVVAPMLSLSFLLELTYSGDFGAWPEAVPDLIVIACFGAACAAALALDRRVTDPSCSTARTCNVGLYLAYVASCVLIVTMEFPSINPRLLR